MGGIGTASALAKFYQVISGRLPGPFSENIRLKHRHGPANQAHIVTQRFDLRWKELVQQSPFIHDITNHSCEELLPDDGEQFTVIFPSGHDL